MVEIVDRSADGRAALFRHQRRQRIRQRGLPRTIHAIDGDADDARRMAFDDGGGETGQQDPWASLRSSSQ